MDFACEDTAAKREHGENYTHLRRRSLEEALDSSTLEMQKDILPNHEDFSTEDNPSPRCFALCPPHDQFGRYLTTCVCVVLFWAVLWSVLGSEAFPGKTVFSLFVLFVGASLGGFLLENIPYLQLPRLLGMLVVGFLLRNVDAINVAQHIDKEWSMILRNIALVVILQRSGLGLDTDALKRLKFAIARLAICPLTAESVVVAIVAYFLLDMPWFWAFQLGFVVEAVSPAVVVPSMLHLQGLGYGTSKGIPTLVMAASSCDNVLAISMFGVFLGLAFSSGNLVFSIFRGPLEMLMGVVFGSLIGVLCWYLPSKSEESSGRRRFLILFGFGLLSLFGSKRVNFSGAGALGVIIMAMVAAVGWGKEEKKPVAQITAVVWEFFEPLLFGLIGAEVSIQYMDATLIGQSFIILAVGVSVRFVVTASVVFGSNLNIKEKLFIAISWIPKATVQAAVGSISLDTALEHGLEGKHEEQMGIQILTIAVLAIVVTAPIGAIAIFVSGPKMLLKAEKTVLMEELSPEPSTNNTAIDKQGQETEQNTHRKIMNGSKPLCLQHHSEVQEWNSSASDGSLRDDECTTSV